MAAYVIANVKVSNPLQYEQYRLLSPGAIKAAGGEFVVRGGRSETLEGSFAGERTVVLKFPTYEAARAFYDSPLYREARNARAGATEVFNMLVVEGME